jgi:hypothetical protein
MVSRSLRCAALRCDFCSADFGSPLVNRSLRCKLITLRCAATPQRSADFALKQAFRSLRCTFCSANFDLSKKIEVCAATILTQNSLIFIEIYLKMAGI